MLLSEGEHLQVREMGAPFLHEVVAPAPTTSTSARIPTRIVKQMGELAHGLAVPENTAVRPGPLSTRSPSRRSPGLAAPPRSPWRRTCPGLRPRGGGGHRAGSSASSFRWRRVRRSGFGLTEPRPGSDAAGTKSPRDVDGGWRVNGSRSTSRTAACEVHHVTPNDASKGTKGISAFIMDTATEGFRVGKREKKRGCAHPTPSRSCSRTASSDDGCSGSGGGFSAFMKTLTAGASRSALALGGNQGPSSTRRSTPRSASSSARRSRAPGHPVHVAEMATRIEASRLMVYHAAMLRDPARRTRRKPRRRSCPERDRDVGDRTGMITHAFRT